ncbi:Cwf15/Cwc15 cell cycle control protein [Lactarius hengduanensis]|nr:Cwf15/Cwc15 cell cycle control protein [Lactarius hengduanensis]
MSTAHRPTWDPAQTREVKGGSRHSVRDMATHTKLKFRYTQTTRPDLRGRSKSVTYARTSSRRRRKLAKMRQPAGLPVEDAPMAPEDEEAKKRRKVLQEALEMDKDADSDEGDGDGANDSKGNANGDRGGEEEDRGDDDEEDVTTELLRELEKIKRERAAEHARVEQAEAEATEAEREARIATANPLLNLSAALGNAPGINTTAPGTFALKRRWDDGQFVNDLFRTEFHKKSMSRFIK